ncbi:alpha amylase N-terminal ig-like domain-containing protein [Lactiplantibacillus carotarum]|uniref:alpha amylase N-terminal ig-like domain-containing protein n=1 Tax=Lactiplantibacillus carotarum TaxID=2993456 RepID=UPI00298F0E89|nr:alpha amylase N-terminal ig-like domain-containing protein [Lactiplantibacillus carotarum]
MLLAGILHRPESEDTAITADHDVILRLKTALDDVLSVEVAYADMYLWQEGAPMNHVEMHQDLATQSNQYWTLPVTIPTNRLVYAFKITDLNGDTVGYGDDGFLMI